MMDPAPLHHALREEMDDAIARVIADGKFVLGEAVASFEEKVARYLGVRHAIGVASGTDALTLALLAAGIGHGDEVITTSFSFWATAEAIHRTGARAVYVDILDADMNIDASGIEASITPATRAILPVHLFGQCAEMDVIIAIARRHGLAVIEDAAQAFGAAFGATGQYAGSFGLAGCFSFHPTKPLGALGDGGLVVTDDSVLAELLRGLRNHCSAGHHRHTGFGCASRLDSLQAAILDVKLKHLDAHLAERRRLAGVYEEGLASTPLQLPRAPADRVPVYSQYTVRSDARDTLQEWLSDSGIASTVHYPMPLYRQPACAHEHRGLHLAVAEAASRRCLSLPLYYGMQEEQQARVIDAVQRFHVPDRQCPGAGK